MVRTGFMTGGRPLRFLALALGGWMAIRTALLLPDMRALPDGYPPSIRQSIPRPGPRHGPHLAPRLVKALLPQVAVTTFRTPRPSSARAVALRSGRASAMLQTFMIPPPAQRHDVVVRPTKRQRAIIAIQGVALDTGAVEHDVPVPSPFAPPAIRGANRLGGTAWLLARGGPGGTVSGGRLGASQGGIRVTYALGDTRRFALAARFAAPLKGAGREAALGVEWQPTVLPVRVIAEQRFVLDGGRGGPTIGVIAGYGPADIAHGVRLETYGQAGVIARDGIEGFIDASARMTHRIGTALGRPVEIGIGLWGSAQRGAQRFDIGPSATTTMPVSGKTLRLTLDWRARIAGAARPGSGPALSIGSDF